MRRAGLLVIAMTALSGCMSMMAYPGNSGADQLNAMPDRAATLSAPPDPVDRGFAMLLNSYRYRLGEGLVEHDGRLDTAAQNHAEDMFENGFVGHTGSDGRSTGARIAAVGYDARGFGEALGDSPGSEEDALNAWADDPADAAILARPEFRDFGLGLAGRGAGQRWVLILAHE
jgi:uncharacterized protein YkwD